MPLPHRRRRHRRSRVEVLTAAEHRRRHLPGRPFKVAADLEVKAFVDSALETMTLAEIVAAARARFGKDRAPSYGAIYRYWTRIRPTRVSETPAPALADPESAGSTAPRPAFNRP